ncbi:MAG: hypothetical protein WAX07_07385 [Candidatus Altiarchaeia archaeon]
MVIVTSVSRVVARLKSVKSKRKEQYTMIATTTKKALVHATPIAQKKNALKKTVRRIAQTLSANAIAVG